MNHDRSVKVEQCNSAQLGNSFFLEWNHLEEFVVHPKTVEAF